MQAADKADDMALAALEARLSLEEIAHFRAAVAAQHSRHLSADRCVLQHAMDAVDAVVGTPLAVPKQVQSMLFQQCLRQPRQQHAAQSSISVAVSVMVPKLGFQLAVGEEWMALTPRVPCFPFSTLEAAIRGVKLDLQPTGIEWKYLESMQCRDGILLPISDLWGSVSQHL